MTNLEQKIIMAKQNMQFIDCQTMEYSKALILQEQLREKRAKDEVPDTILFVEHEHVYTVGRDLAGTSGGNGNSLVNKCALIKETLPAPLVEVGRGGKITYHGPGQLVAYCIFKLLQKEIFSFIDYIEDVTISTLQNFGIDAYSRKHEKDSYRKSIRGAWCSLNGKHKKIAAQGIETKRVDGLGTEQEPMIVTMHGFALNVNTDLDYFKKINPCGFTYDVMTSMQEVLGYEVGVGEVKEVVKSVPLIHNL